MHLHIKVGWIEDCEHNNSTNNVGRYVEHAVTCMKLMSRCDVVVGMRH